MLPLVGPALVEPQAVAQRCVDPVVAVRIHKDAAVAAEGHVPGQIVDEHHVAQVGAVGLGNQPVVVGHQDVVAVAGETLDAAGRQLVALEHLGGRAGGGVVDEDAMPGAVHPDVLAVVDEHALYGPPAGEGVELGAEVGHAVGARVVGQEDALHHLDEQPAVAQLARRVDERVGQIALALEGLHGVAVVAAQARRGREPHEALRVAENVVDLIEWQAILHADVLEHVGAAGTRSRQGRRGGNEQRCYQTLHKPIVF